MSSTSFPPDSAADVPCRYELQSASRPDMPINHVDIAPTSLGLYGIPVPETMEGTDYSGHVTGASDCQTWLIYPDSAYLSLPVPTGHQESVDRAWRGVVTRDNWKYVCLEGRPWMLFNLVDDPYELVTLAHEPTYHAKRAELRQRLLDWINDTATHSALRCDRSQA